MSKEVSRSSYTFIDKVIPMVFLLSYSYTCVIDMHYEYNILLIYYYYYVYYKYTNVLAVTIIVILMSLLLQLRQDKNTPIITISARLSTLLFDIISRTFVLQKIIKITRRDKTVCKINVILFANEIETRLSFVCIFCNVYNTINGHNDYLAFTISTRIHNTQITR